MGQDEFKAATVLARDGKTQAAIDAFQKLRMEYKGTWIDRVSQDRLVKLRASPQK